MNKSEFKPGTPAAWVGALPLSYSSQGDIHCTYSPNYYTEKNFFSSWITNLVLLQEFFYAHWEFFEWLYMYLCRWHTGTWIPTKSTQSWQNSLWIIMLCLPSPLRLARHFLVLRCCRWTGTCSLSQNCSSLLVLKN